MLADRLVRLEIPHIGNSEDAYGRTLAYVYLDANDVGRYEHLYNEHLIELGLARRSSSAGLCGPDQPKPAPRRRHLPR